jgi:hypothetical protein
MTTLNLQATHSTTWTVPGLSSILAFFTFIADVVGDAQNTMREANKKYPYAGI